MALTRWQLLRMSPEELDELFGTSEAGPLPDGEGTGTAMALPGTWLAIKIAWLARWFLWQGKVFDAKEGCLKNRFSPFSLKAIKAKVFGAAQRGLTRVTTVARSPFFSAGVHDGPNSPADVHNPESMAAAF